VGLALRTTPLRRFDPFFFLQKEQGLETQFAQEKNADLH
jgi:hypothetical protein